MRRVLIRIMLNLLLMLALPPAGLALYWWATFPDVGSLATTNPAFTALMDARAEEAQAKGLPARTDWIWVPLDQIAPHLQYAVIVSEDASFYFHEGFDWEGIQEAAWRNVLRGTLRRGGSTITQQLAKNLYLSSDKTLLRKASEALIAYSLERHLTKKRILELYLNVVEWGDGVYGAEAAARHHFGTSARDLTPDEAALLAAILPAPRAYEPLQITRYLSVRQQQIMRLMEARQGMKSLTGNEQGTRIAPRREKADDAPLPPHPSRETD